MQRREQYLLIGLVAAVLLWQGGQVVSNTFLTPLWNRQNDLTKLQDSVSEKNKALVVLARQKKLLTDWKRRSLPPDPASLSKRTGQGAPRPSANNALRLYQDWLLDLAQLSGFEQLKIAPDRMAVSPDNVYVAVHVKIDGEIRYEQLCRFLDRFYRADLLHSISSIRIKSPEAEGDPILTVQIDAEGLALVDAPQRRRLFAQTTLVEELSDDATTLTVKSSEGFPKEPGFLVLVRNEYLTVTAMAENVWTVTRAQDGTTAASAPSGTIVEDAPINPEVPARTDEQIKQLLASNVFVKPVPAAQFKPKVSPLSEKTLVRGKPLEFNVVFTGYDSARGRPQFSLIEPIIPGSKIDPGTGKFSWAPPSDQKAGKYDFKFEIRHPSLAGGRLSDTIHVALREPNTPPRFLPSLPPPVYLGREWTFLPKVADAESKPDRLTWKLGENPPMGLEVNSSTGELTWTPDDTVEIAKVKASVIATDDGSPPLSATLVLDLDVQDDAAMFTYLTTVFFQDEIPLAVFYDRSKGKSIELKVGSRFLVSDIKGVVTKIEKRALQFAQGEVTHKIEIGQSLRETMDQAEPVATPKTRPVETPAETPVDSPARADEPETPGKNDRPDSDRDSAGDPKQPAPKSPANPTPTPTSPNPPGDQSPPDSDSGRKHFPTDPASVDS